MWQAYLQDKISSAIGASVAFEKLSISPFRGVADGRGLIARLDETATPFLTVERVQLKLKMSDLLAKQLTIETVLLERPVLTIERGGDGTWNLPLPKPKLSKPPAPPVETVPGKKDESSSSWATGVRQIILTDGSITYRDQSQGFDGYTAEARPINLQFDMPDLASVTGTIAGIRRLDRPAELGALRVVGEGAGLYALPDLDKVSGKLSLEQPPLLRIDLDATAREVHVVLAVQAVMADLLKLLPPRLTDRLPPFLGSARSNLNWDATWAR